MEIHVVVIGQMDNSQDHTYESANRIYYRGVLPYHSDRSWRWAFAKGIKRMEKKKEPIIIGRMNNHQWGIIYCGGV